MVNKSSVLFSTYFLSTYHFLLLICECECISARGITLFWCVRRNPYVTACDVVTLTVETCIIPMLPTSQAFHHLCDFKKADLECFEYTIGMAHCIIITVHICMSLRGKDRAGRQTHVEREKEREIERERERYWERQRGGVYVNERVTFCSNQFSFTFCYGYGSTPLARRKQEICILDHV